MPAFKFSRCVLSMCVIAALLSACGGGSSIPRAISGVTSDVGAQKNSKTFRYTGKQQTFIVPAGVKQLTVVAHGGEGAGVSVYPSTDTPGRSGRVYAIVPVHAGDKLYVFVGGSGTHGGFNGGGAGGTGGRNDEGNPGGGASDIRTGGDTLKDRIIVAAGGGGAGQVIYEYGYAYGGNGGGLTGQSGGGAGSGASGGGGGGGTKSAGVSGGPSGQFCGDSGYYGQPGAKGSLGLGGSGGSADPGSQNAAGGGGGGGGYYGGGGGGSGDGCVYGSAYYASQGGGGGGGSSYVEPSALKSHMWTGWKAKGDGLVVFSWN
jgi:hypothetical protein